MEGEGEREVYEGWRGGMDPSGEAEEKGAGCVGDSELRVDGGSVMRFRILNGIPGTNIHDKGFRHWVAVKPSLVSSRTRTRFL